MLTLCAEGYTDAQGRLSFTDLPLGEYSFREFKAPKGYVLDETAHTVTISASEVSAIESVTDERRPGTLVVKKESSDGSTWAPVFSRTGNEIIRGGCTAAGKLTVKGVEDDSYTLTEVKTDSAYTLLKTPAASTCRRPAARATGCSP